ncbi:MAG: RDD family protein [Bacteroidia bacterium]
MSTDIIDSFTSIEPPYKRNLPASNTKRFLNYLIDTIAFYVIALIGAVYFQLRNGELTMPEVYGLTALSIIIYYFPLEAQSGKTLGKLITGTRVVTVEGNIPTWQNILGRTLCRFIPFDNFSFLFTTGFHDNFSKTIVVDEKKFVEEADSWGRN